MSTVGISFGSPTSGQGFDVSATVSQIVANLQGVETPWTTQLTSLGSEDSALTSIGTDLSTLSSALEPLTDFAGVLSEKEGSSSNTDVLALTAAASDAVAGNYNVVVGNLAQTASYYSAVPIAASDTLSGSLTVGSAPAITIDSSNNTLSTLASYINAGSYGVTASVVATSGGDELSLVSNTAGYAGNFDVTSNLTDTTTTPGQTVDFQRGQPGKDASLTVNGVPATSASNTITGAIPGVTFQLVSASTTAVQVEITNDNSDVESAVSSFVSAYNTVIGDLNTQEGNDSSGNPEPLFGNPTVATLQEDLESALAFIQPANVVGTTSPIGTSDVLSGTLSIAVGGNAAVPVTVPANATLSTLATAINNTANVGVTASVLTSGSTSTLSLANSTSGAKGAIVLTANLTDTTSAAPVTFSTPQANAVTSATQLGISVNDDGTLSLDTDTLDSILDSNYQDVVNFLEPSGTFASFGGNFTSALNNVSNSAPDGVIYLALQSDSSTESQLNTNVSNENEYISSQQTLLTTELNEANYTLEEIPTQLDEVNELYSAITGYDENPLGG
jgi:flagellar hook-associated protein 2